jgi:hypothetical protein
MPDPPDEMHFADDTFGSRRPGWLTRHVQDCIEVYNWDKRLYRHVLATGLVLGGAIGGFSVLFVAFIVWAVLR